MNEEQKRALDLAGDAIGRMTAEEFALAMDEVVEGDYSRIEEHSTPVAAKQFNITFKPVELTKLSLKPGDTLAVTIKSDDMDGSTIQSLKKGLETQFPGNKILIFGLGLNDSLDFTALSDSNLEISENKSCNSANYCVDCSCGKKESYEKQS